MDKDLWMNALKLADDLDNANGFQYIAQLGLASQAATMLRQQQAEIESLKGGFFDWSSVKSVIKVNHEFNSSQLKELTDEEIIQTYADIDGKGIVEFAKAILIKAQEK